MKELGDEIRTIVEASARLWATALAGLRDVQKPTQPGVTHVKTEEVIRAEVLRWFPAWWEAASDRLCALLVAGYFRTRGPFGVEGEEKYLQLRQPQGLAFLKWVEESADRSLTASEVIDAAWEGGEALRVFRRDAVVADAQQQFALQAIVDCLRLALNDPRRAASRLILPGVREEDEAWRPFTPSYSAIQQVVECFCPAGWNRTPPDWTPPPEAVLWARRIYDEHAFHELPILADLLEDSDCPDRPLLDHCRHCKAHFRGCAAVERLLGRS